MKTFLTLSVVALSSTAFCQLSAVGPFSGSMSETFESFPNYSSGGHYDTLGIMGGGATMTSNSSGTNQVWVYEPGVATWSLGGNGSAITHSGAKAGGLYFNQSPVDVSIVFSTAVNRFGGYFATASNETTLISFYDANGGQIGTTQSLLTASNSMDWQGWSSTTGIASVLFFGGTAPVMDDLQADAVPEPVSLVVLGLGSLVALRRRRRA